jgi:phage terminase large subunit-like protein
MSVLLGRKDIGQSDWLFARCREVQAEPNGCLDLWAREHYKSTIITVGLTIQELLNDPELTFGIFSHTRPIAKKFLVQIMREFENNEPLKDLYPDILWKYPKKNAPKWSEDGGLIVKRKGNPKESSIEAWGLVDGQPTGQHFTRLLYDDVVTLDSVGTPDMILKTTKAWENSTNLGAQGGIKRAIGTRYHAFDTWKALLDRGSFKERRHACTFDGTDNFAPKNCVFMTPELLAQKRKDQGIYTFGAQMLLNPTADKAQGFKEEWLRYWPCAHFNDLNFYIMVDPANDKKKTSDYTVMWVIGYGADGRFYICDVLRDRLNLGERTRALMALHRHWSAFGSIDEVGGVRQVGYEQYGKDSDIEAIEAEMKRQNYRFEITPLGGPMAKPDRIKRLVPKFEAGMIYLPEGGILRTNYEREQQDLIRIFISDEYNPFPVLAHDDMLDCLARILDEDIHLVKPQHFIKASPSWKDELGMGDNPSPDFMVQ